MKSPSLCRLPGESNQGREWHTSHDLRVPLQVHAHESGKGKASRGSAHEATFIAS
jgi:hypothetical protein